MKKKDILYLNEGHQVVVEGLMEDVKKIMYYATEDEISGKYQDFLNILDSVYLYSNNFHETTLKIEGDDVILLTYRSDGPKCRTLVETLRQRLEQQLTEL